MNRRCWTKCLFLGAALLFGCSDEAEYPGRNQAPASNDQETSESVPAENATSSQARTTRTRALHPRLTKMANLERLFSFKYSEKLTKEGWLNFFDSFASKHGMSLVEQGTDTLPGCDENSLEEAAKSMWSEASLAKLRAASLLPLSGSKVQIFAKPVPIDTYLYRTTDGQIEMKVDAAEDNIYPVIGAWTWLDDDLGFVGGFATLRTPNKETEERLAQEFLAFMGDELHRDDEKNKVWQQLACDLGLEPF